MKDKKHESWKNITNYRKGKERLENAVAQHPEEDAKTSIYDFVKRNIKRDFWVIPYERFKKGDK
jgi:hypothetical protein